MHNAAQRTAWRFWISLVLFVVVGSCAHARDVASGAPARTEVRPPGRDDGGAREIELAQSIPEGLPLRDAELRPAAEVWRELFHAAHAHIEVAEFYVQSDPGEAMAPILDELIAAAGRGVRVRVLLSAVMQRNDPQSQARLKAVPGIEVRYLDLAARTGGILHAKYLLVDDDQLYLGSQNFDWRSLTQIHELGVHVRSARLASQLGSIFALDWAMATASPPAAPTTAAATATASTPAASAAAASTATTSAVSAAVIPRSGVPRSVMPLPIPPPPISTPTVASPGPPPEIELVASPPSLLPSGTRSAVDVLVELLRGARQSVQVQLLKYSPYGDHARTVWPVIDAELRAAAARGVRVQLMVSHWNTSHPHIDHLKALTQVPGIAVRIVTVPELPGRFIPFARVIHSKYLIVDGQILWVGTANWEPNMFLGCRNVELVMRRRSLAAQGERVFGALWESPYALAVDPQKDYVPPRIK